MHKKTFWLLGLLILSCWWLWHRRSGATYHTAADRAALVNRIWIDHLPQGETDKIHLFALLDRRQRVGLFEHTSAWEGEFAGFEWRFRATNDDRLQLRFPQTNQTATVVWDVRPCNERGFDLCLTMRGNPRGPQRWYSRKEWVFTAPAELQVWRDRLHKRAF
ncbi:MAG: hypothetical protein NZT92_05250 [Abditibacteriales bacterium]|nr:hypothetical protein [Abditibacteriales bacterium]MDW8365354.1 hypothetical protein [Abditibacteriales bacterium]